MDAPASSVPASPPLSHGVPHMNPALQQLQPQRSVFLPQQLSKAASLCMSSSDHEQNLATAAASCESTQFGCGLSTLGVSAKLESNPPSAATTPAISLSAQAAVGAGIAKVSKRRTKKTSKSPITVLSTDTTNFRAMVQKLTGIPSSPSMQQHQLWGVRMPTLKAPRETDSSSYVLSRGTSPALPSYTHLQNSLGLPFLQSSQPHSDSSNLAAEVALNRARGFLGFC